MTARYPFRTGLQHVTTLSPGSAAAIPKDTATIAEVLKGAGYATHAIGKWHLGFQSWDNTPVGRGFDSFVGYLNGGEDYYTHKIAAGMDLWRNKTAAWDAVGRHNTDVFMDEAKRVLDNHDPSDPLFMYFAHQEVHAPLEEPPDSRSHQQCANQTVPSPIGPNVTAGRHTLCTMASNVDTAVGTFVDMLKAKGMWENTLLWLTTDNGGMTYGIAADGAPPIAVSVSSNWPLRSGKATLFEGGVRGTSFVSGGFLPDAARGKTRTELLQHVDIPATMVKLAGAKWTIGTPDGLDVWDTIVSGAPSNRTEVPLNVDTCVGATGGPPCTKDTKYIDDRTQHRCVASAHRRTNVVTGTTRSSRGTGSSSRRTCTSTTPASRTARSPAPAAPTPRGARARGCTTAGGRSTPTATSPTTRRSARCPRAI